MAKSVQVIPQDYPRIQDEQNPYYGCLDDTTLLPHTHKIPSQELKRLILAAIKNAHKKSSREMLSIPANSLQDEIDKIYIKEGKKQNAPKRAYEFRLAVSIPDPRLCAKIQTV